MALTETRSDSQTITATAASGPGTAAAENASMTGDHLGIGRAFLVASLFFGTVAAFGLALAGLDSATDNGVLGDAATMVWNSSLIGLILGGVLPLLIGLALYVVPLQIASPSISFPRMTAAAMWAWLAGVLLFAVSVALDGGVGGSDGDAARLGNLAVGLMLASLLGATVSAVTTVVTHRPLGMDLSRVPLFSWSMLIAGPIWILNGAAVLAGVVLGHVSDTNAAGLVENYDMMIAQLWRAPSIYMLAIPVLGIAGDVTAKVAGRRISAYGIAQGLIAVFGVFSFGVWAANGRAAQISTWEMNPIPTENIVFSLWVLVPGLAALALLGLYADTIRRSKLRITAAGLAGPFAIVLVLGGAVASALAVVDTIGDGNLVGFDSAELGLAQTLFLIGAAACGAVGGTAFWGEKIWGHVSDAFAKPAVGLLFVGGGVLGVIAGVQAILPTSSRMGSGLYGGLIAAAAGIFALGMLTGLVSAIRAAGAGYSDPVEDDATGLTLEWSAPSPPAPTSVGPAVPAITSPYPLLDLRQGTATGEESK